MTRTKKLFMLIVLFFSLLACSQLPAVTFDVLTPDPAVSATPWVAGTQTAEAFASQPAPAYTQEVLEKPTDFSPVLYGGKFYQTTFFLLLGGVSQDAWLAADVSVARFAGEVTYSLHTLAQESKYFFWGKAPEFSPVCKTYSIGTDATFDEVGTVAVVDGWNVTKRDATELSADGQIYQQVVNDWLSAAGVNAPQIGSLQIFRVDIEGDGTDEIFISATRLDDSQHTIKAGDYSVILMRKVAGNETVTKLVIGDVYASQDLETTFPRTYSIANFIDLNQDGVLEAVVGFERWEGFGAAVYQIDGQNVTEVLRSEC